MLEHRLRLLITGVGGFAGSHLANYVLTRLGANAEVWGCDIAGTRQPFHSPELILRTCDLRDPAAVRALIDDARPDRIYHLAGQAFVGDSWSDPWTTFESNVRSQVNLLETVLAAGLRPRILILGSSEEYGQISPDDLPIGETCALRPDSPYSVSKVAQDLTGLQYYLSYGLPIVRVRPFNHIGPRQNSRFVAPAFASQIAAAEAGRQPPVLRVGNLEARRDFTDVRDTVRAYYQVLEHGAPGEVYNVGSGRAYAIRELLETLVSLAAVEVTVETDPARLRPSNVPEVVCDASKLRAATGWQPEIAFEQTLRDLLAFERAKLVKQP